ncbi:MAG TPA: M28 family peptidase [bacterium]|nr:M28 family peptidase [bacterium]
MHSRSLPTLATARFLLLSAAGLALTACGGPGGPVDGGKAMAHVEKFVSFGPRPFGSDALAKTADYIQQQIESLGLKMQRHEVEHRREKKTIRNLYCRIDGEDPDNGPILMIGAHYDTKRTEGCSEWTHDGPFLGAIDGGGAPAVLIELARAILAMKDRPKCNVWLYWIDAEESIDWTWNDERALLGSKAFCQMLSQQKILPRVKAFVLLDLIGSKAMKIDKDGNSNARLQELFADAAKALGIEERVYRFPTEADIAEYRRRGLNWGTKDDHESFINRGVPSVLLIDFARRIPDGARDERYEAWWHTPDDDLDAMDSDSLALAGNLVMQALADLDAFVHGKKKQR